MKNKILISVAAGAVICVALALIHHIFGTICLIKGITGIPCPGCGMTRAWLAVLRGDIKSALGNHPLFPLAPVLLIGILGYVFPVRPLFRKVSEITLLASGAIFIVVWVIRLAYGWR